MPTANNNLSTNFNVDPYYDDYDEYKNFHRILYRPGFAVQARELTQQQSILQNQIHRFGNHVFKDGSEITGTTEVLNQVGVFRLKSTYGGVAINVSEHDNRFVRSRGSKELFKVKKTVAASGGEFDLLFVQYLRSANTTSDPSEIYNVVANNEVLDFSASYINANSVFSSNCGAAQIISTAQGSAVKKPITRGYLYSIDDSIYYHKGLFIRTPAQTVVVAANNQHAVSVGLESSETLVTSDDDTTLTDPARGSYNYAAPGADRLKVEMTLVAKPLTSIDAQLPSSNNYVELARVFNGDLTRIRRDPDYNLLADELATRTYEESGNYAVEGLNLSVSNTVATSSNLVAVFTPGTAYVKGYRNRTVARRYVSLPKARSTDSVTEQNITALYGNYLIANTLSIGLPNIDDRVELHANTVAGPGSKIGEAHIKNLEYLSGSGNTRKYKIFLYDVNITNSVKNFNNVRSIIKGTYSAQTAYAAVHSDSITTFSKTGSITSGSPTVRFTSAAGIKVGQIVTGSSVDVDTKVNSISFDEVTLSKNATATEANGTLTFSSVNLIDTDFHRSYFAMPHVNVVNVDNIDYKFKRKFGSVTFTGGVATIQTLSGAERFSSGSGDLVNENFIVVTTSAGGSLSAGENIDLTASGRSAVPAAAVPGNPQSATITLNDASFNGTADIIASIDVTADSRRVKTRNSNQQKTLVGYPAVGTKSSLGYSDVIKINAIYEGNTTLVTSNSTIVTDKFLFDNGQRDNFYDHGTISLKPGYSANLTNLLLVDFDYYSHGGGLGYFCDKSYPDYTNIPTYTTSTGEDVYLRDVLDFRPTRTADASANVYSTSKTFDNHQIVDSQTFEVESDYSYYKSVVHKISLDHNGNFVLVTGTPALNNPPVPEHNSDHMLLATFFMNPYTYNEEDMTIRLEDNRRYTMRDIGKIQKRVENLEYYTSLNLLETQVQSQQFLDDEGDARFKSGFLTDPFRGHSVGDVFNSDYKASMDPVNQVMRPTFSSDAVPIVPSTSSFAIRNGIATLPYTEVGYLDQQIASGTINVNPFQISTFVGSLKLFPSQDHWVDVNNRPQITVNTKNDVAQYAALSKIIDNKGGYEYGNWEYNNLSGSANEWFEGIRQYVNYQESQRTRSKLTIKPLERVHDRQRIKLDSVVLPYMRTRKVLFEAKGLRPNKQLHVFFGGEDITQYAAPSTFNSSRVEQVLYGSGRGKDIVTDDNGTATGYFWVPNKDQTLSRSAYDANPNAAVRPNLSNASKSGTKFTAGVVEVMVCDNFINPNFSTTFASEFYGAQGSRDTYQPTVYTTKTYSIVSRPAGVQHGPTITTGSFFLRTPTTLTQFLDDNFPGHGADHVAIANQIATWYVQYFTRRPEQGGMFHWMDQWFNRMTEGSGTTLANTERLNALDDHIVYAGWQNQEPDFTDLLRSRYKEITGQTDSVGSHEEVAPSDTDQGNTSRFNQLLQTIGVKRPCDSGVDPLAQTFSVSPEFYSHGVFITSVDVFIAQKDTVLPLTVEIRPTVNGFPSATDYVPMSRVSVNPAQINANASTPTATNIKFDAPIFLAPGEYAIVLRTDSDQYLTYIATIGEDRLDGTGEITQQPTMGSLFKSQNARTWTPQQESDLCFKLYNASFTKNVNYTSVLVANNVARAAYEANTVYANTVGQYDLANINVARYDKLEPVFSQYEILTKNKGGSVQPYLKVEPNQNIVFDASKEITTNSDLQVRVTLRTSDSDVSPILNFNSPAVTLVKNIISTVPTGNNYVAETSSSGGNATARYITRKVSLSKDLSARALKVFVDQNTPKGATVEVYYRVINNDDSTKFEERPYVLMSRRQASVPISDDARQYTELEYYADDITYTQDGVTYDEFDAFVIKIVMYATSTAAAPSFRNFRAIALA